MELPRDYNAAVDLVGRNLAAGRGSKVAYVDDTETCTYAQLAERVDRAANLLRSMDIRREDRIGLAMLDSVDWVALFLGAIKAGTVPVAMNTLLTRDDYEYQLRDSRARVLFVSEPLLKSFAGLECPDLRRVVLHAELKELLVREHPTADSVVLDPHKGLFLPYGCGAVLVRDGDALRKGFAFTSSYLKDVHAGGEVSPADYSPELTRHFRGLRLWMSLKLHGIERFRAALEEKLILAQLAYERLTAMPGIETVSAPQLSCVAFRVRDQGDQATDRLHAHLLQRGRVQLSSTRLWGRLYLRLCILCFRSHWSDLEEALAEIEAATDACFGSPRPAPR